MTTILIEAHNKVRDSLSRFSGGGWPLRSRGREGARETPYFASALLYQVGS